MKKNNSHTFWLGIFVVAGVIIFTLAVYYIGNRQNLFGNTAKISSVFKNVNGLQLGNNVRYSGVNVGTVKGITILNDTSICVDMYIEEKAIKLIKANSMATISSDGLVGSMIVNIIPGEENHTKYIRPGDTLGSLSKIATADMLQTLNTTNENAALLTADLLKITNAINNGEGALGALIKDEKLATDFKESISNLQHTSKNARITINRLNSIIKDVNLDESVAGILLKDTTAANKVMKLLENLETTSQDITAISNNLNEFSNEINSSEGMLNYVIKDTSFVENFDTTLENVEEASIKLNENMEALKHNFLFRGYFKKQERKLRRQLRKSN